MLNFVNYTCVLTRSTILSVAEFVLKVPDLALHLKNVKNIYHNEPLQYLKQVDLEHSTINF